MAWRDSSVLALGRSDCQEGSAIAALSPLVRPRIETVQIVYRSGFESFTEDMLRISSVGFSYGKTAFSMDDPSNPGGQRTYVPDFITNLTIGGKTVLLEPHSKNLFSRRHREKFGAFMRDYGNEYYLVIITDMARGDLKGAHGSKIANEIWFVGDLDRWRRGADHLTEEDRFVLAKIRELVKKSAPQMRSDDEPSLQPAAVLQL
jgi:hypothetical protein